MQNEELIRAFYTAFQHKDYRSMQAFYADQAVFNDAVFTNLNAAQVRAMWEMLIRRGKDLDLVFDKVWTDGEQAGAEWVATYTFSATQRKVINRIKAGFVLENGKIIRHQDDFNFYAWARQAFGMPGFLLGWTTFFRNKVRQKAMESLRVFMEQPGNEAQTQSD